MLILNLIFLISFLAVAMIAIDAYGIISKQEKTIRDYEELILKLEEGVE